MEGCIRGVFEPGLDEDAVVGLQNEVFGNVIHNYTFIQRSANLAEVLHKDHASWRSMLSVQAIGDAFLLIDLVKHPVCVVLHRSCKDDNLVNLTHLLQEFVASRSNAERAFTTIFIIMDQCFIQVQN